MSVTIKVLEKALCVKSVLSNEFLEIFNNSLNISPLFFGSCWSAVDYIRACNAYRCVQIFLKSLLCKNFINIITELSPLDVSSFFWCFISLTELFKFLLWDAEFAHIEADSELRSGYEAGPEFVEISEELTDSDSLFQTSSSDTSKNIINIIWSVANYLCFARACLSLWEVIETVIEIAANSEKLLLIVNIFCEVNIVHFINITQVHVSPKKLLKLSRWCCDL